MLSATVILEFIRGRVSMERSVDGESLVKRLEKEIEFKAQLLAEGVRIDDDALEGVGDIYYGYPAIMPMSHWQRPKRPDIWWPDNLVFPLGTKVKCYSNYESPFNIRKEKDTLVIEKNGRFVSTCEWGKRANDFEDTLLSDGKTRAGEVVTFLCGCHFIIQKTMICDNWMTNESCRYCDVYHPEKISRLLEIVAETQTDTRRRTFSMGGTPEQVAEAAEIAHKLDYHFHYILVGGFSPDYNFFIPYIEAVKNRTGEKYLRGVIAIGAPVNLSEIDRVYEYGLSGIQMDIEVWHPGMFEYICPGKSRRVGREGWLKALEHAGKAFRPGNTASALVTGLESKKEYLEAAEWCGERGVLLYTCSYQPFWGTPLEGHRPPTWQWLLEVNYEVHDIIAKYLPTKSDEFFDSGVITCYNCGLFSLFYDIVRLSRGGTISMDEKGHLIRLGDQGWERFDEGPWHERAWCSGIMGRPR